MGDSLYISSKIEVKESSVHGYGVFAKENLEAGEVLEECYYLDLGTRWTEVPDVLKDYVYALPRSSPKIPAKSAAVLGYAMIYNHSDKFSVDYKCDVKNKIFTYWINRDVKAGEELFTTYGKSSYSAKRIEMKKWMTT